VSRIDRKYLEISILVSLDHFEEKYKWNPIWRNLVLGHELEALNVSVYPNESCELKKAVPEEQPKSKA